MQAVNTGKNPVMQGDNYKNYHVVDFSVHR